MDKVVRVCTGGPVSQMGSGADFGGMEVTILVFRESPGFQTLMTMIKSTFGWDEPGVVVGMQGQYDTRFGSKVHALLIPISSDDD